MSDTPGQSGAFLYFWARYLADTRDGPAFRLNQNSPAMAGLRPGDTIWAFAPVSKGRYVIVARLAASATGENPPGSTEREADGRWFAEAAPAQALYFRLEGQPDLPDLIRGLGIRAEAQVLGQAFQGGAAVRRLTSEASAALDEASRSFILDRRLTPVEAVPKVRISRLESREAVLRAIEEHDRLGQAEFLARYGYGEPDRYWIEHGGTLYPSKALLGVAWRYDGPGRRPLLPIQFSGGKDTVQPKAEQLGFRVVVREIGDQPLANAPTGRDGHQAEQQSNRPSFWWVNNKQTHRHEIRGGYLWLPKANKNGARNQTYDNMRRVRAGDVVFAYSDQRISHVGVVTRPAAPAVKPPEFGGTGEHWSREGWLVPVSWRAAPSPIHPRDLIEDLRPHLPDRHSPLRPETGGGNQNVYLAAISPALAGVLLPQLGLSREELRASTSESNGDSRALDRGDDALEALVKVDPGLSATEREAVVAARRGQGRFRAAVLVVEPCCRLTGVADQRLLRASHIRPWRACETHAQRLDGENGLMLTPTADHLFDQGYISFADDGTLLVSPQIDPADLERLGIPAKVPRNVGTFIEGQQAYLAYHRSNIFLSEGQR
ncbi:HNH endonuclease [Dankookia rubra]|uniref:HNH endonuclease n=1 Tax=Dankookia rubra TaxID=1442381 RepID=A0A4V6PKB1_9PROT|nr:HNH endonuclease signature motif containing protein [Dankookia rubra]TDH60285.1 HNH endonuclease [Dankookia rubra]